VPSAGEARRNLEQWHDHELAFEQPRVRHREPRSRDLIVAEREDVQVDGARPLLLGAHTAQRVLGVVQVIEQLLRV